MADPYAHPLVRKQFDWWEDVENDIPLKTTSVHTPTVHIKATKPDDKYAYLLVREQFDWCEDVENDIAMKAKSIAMDTDVPVNTENLAVSSTDHATATEPNDEYPQLPINHYCLEDTKEDAASIGPAISRKLNDEYAQFTVDHDRLSCANDDITFTGPTTCSNVSDEYAQFTVHRDSDDDKSDLAMDIDDLTVDNELHNANNGAVTAIGVHDSYADLPHPETFDLVDDAENDIAMNTEDPVIDIGLQESMSEYEYRSIVGSHDENIHHWNRFGSPVYIGNRPFENGSPISRYELGRRAELVTARQGPVRFPRKLTWKPTPSKLKIQSMPTIDNNPPQSNSLRTYSFVSLETASKITKKTWLAAKRIPHTSISLPAGIMETMIKKVWCRLKTDPDPISGSRFSTMGRPIRKAWSTITCILQKSFDFSLWNVKAGIRKAWHLTEAVFTPHRLIPDVLSWLLSF